MSCSGCAGRRLRFRAVVTSNPVVKSGGVGEVWARTDLSDQREGAESWRLGLPAGPVSVKLLLGDLAVVDSGQRLAMFIQNAELEVVGRIVEATKYEGQEPPPLTVHTEKLRVLSWPTPEAAGVPV